MSNQILVVEDDPDIFELVSTVITGLGFDAEHAADGETGLQRALDNDFSLILLDVMLPKLDGMEVCQRIRQSNSSVPILMLTARDQELDRVMGLEFGADDYLTKPFSVPELRARIKALLRRLSRSAGSADSTSSSEGKALPTVLVHSELIIDIEKQKVTKNGVLLSLTPKEFELLLYLASKPGIPYSRTVLLEKVWGYDVAAYENTVNSHVNRLRSKIEDDPAEPRFIKTVRGVGYRFAEPDELL